MPDGFHSIYKWYFDSVLNTNLSLDLNNLWLVSISTQENEKDFLEILRKEAARYDYSSIHVDKTGIVTGFNEKNIAKMVDEAWLSNIRQIPSDLNIEEWGSKNVLVNVKSVSLPNEDLATRPIELGAGYTWIPPMLADKHSQFAPFQLGMYYTTYPFSDFIIRPWMMSVNRFGLKVRTLRANIMCTLFTKNNPLSPKSNNWFPKIQYKFFGCYPLTVPNLEFKYDEPDSLKDTNISFGYDFYRIGIPDKRYLEPHDISEIVSDTEEFKNSLKQDFEKEVEVRDADTVTSYKIKYSEADDVNPKSVKFRKKGVFFNSFVFEFMNDTKIVGHELKVDSSDDYYFTSYIPKYVNIFDDSNEISYVPKFVNLFDQSFFTIYMPKDVEIDDDGHDIEYIYKLPSFFDAIHFVWSIREYPGFFDEPIFPAYQKEWVDIFDDANNVIYLKEPVRINDEPGLIYTLLDRAGPDEPYIVGNERINPGYDEPSHVINEGYMVGVDEPHTVSNELFRVGIDEPNNISHEQHYVDIDEPNSIESTIGSIGKDEPDNVYSLLGEVSADEPKNVDSLRKFVELDEPSGVNGVSKWVELDEPSGMNSIISTVELDEPSGTHSNKLFVDGNDEPYKVDYLENKVDDDETNKIKYNKKSVKKEKLNNDFKFFSIDEDDTDDIEFKIASVEEEEYKTSHNELSIDDDDKIIITSDEFDIRDDKIDLKFKENLVSPEKLLTSTSEKSIISENFKNAFNEISVGYDEPILSINLD